MEKLRTQAEASRSRQPEEHVEETGLEQWDEAGIQWGAVKFQVPQREAWSTR